VKYLMPTQPACLTDGLLCNPQFLNEMVSGEGPASERALRVLAGRRVDGTNHEVAASARYLIVRVGRQCVRCSEPRYSCGRQRLSGAHRFRGICSPVVFGLDSSGTVTFACVLADWRPPCSLNVSSVCNGGTRTKINPNSTFLHY
jgi:hypothetical protein